MPIQLIHLPYRQWILLGLLGFTMPACTPKGNPIEKNQTPTNSTKVLASTLDIRQNEGKAYLDSILFSGVATKYHTNGRLAEEVSYERGKREGHHKKWYKDGTLSYEAYYQNNRLNGTAKSWWQNDKLRSQSSFQHGKANGIQKQWYETGQLFKLQNVVNGKEEGLQKAWRKNGKLFANYEARNGRIFGLKRANLCYELTNEKITYK